MAKNKPPYLRFISKYKNVYEFPFTGVYTMLGKDAYLRNRRKKIGTYYDIFNEPLPKKKVIKMLRTRGMKGGFILFKDNAVTEEQVLRYFYDRFLRFLEEIKDVRPQIVPIASDFGFYFDQEGKRFVFNGFNQGVLVEMIGFNKDFLVYLATDICNVLKQDMVFAYDYNNKYRFFVSAHDLRDVRKSKGLFKRLKAKFLTQK